MCLLTVLPMPDLDSGGLENRLLNGAYMNPHGSGWAVVTGAHIVTGRSLKAEEAVDDFLPAYADATGPALFHSRWATHGEKTVDNVHPFPVGRLADVYVAHNGIMPTDAWPDKDDNRSDTRVFADDILPARYRRLDSSKVRWSLANWLAGNKVAVLSTNRSLSRNLYMFGTKQGEWLDGVWFSNSDHEGYGRYAGLFAQAGGEKDCLWCNTTDSVNEAGYCTTCGTCQDCTEPADLCQCYGEPADGEPKELELYEGHIIGRAS